LQEPYTTNQQFIGSQVIFKKLEDQWDEIMKNDAKVKEIRDSLFPIVS